MDLGDVRAAPACIHYLGQEYDALILAGAFAIVQRDHNVRERLRPPARVLPAHKRDEEP